MNVALSTRHTVHAAQAGGSAPLCPAKASQPFQTTEREVTCKSCLKLLAAEAEREAAYQNRLAASMMPATESDDLGYVAPAGAEAEQPEEIRNIREAAEDAACNARVDAALLRATAKLGAAPVAEAPQCTCECTWQCERPADEPCTCPCTCSATRVATAEMDAAHTEALALQDADTKVMIPGLCRCGHTNHSYGVCYVGTSCGCATYRPCGLEAVRNARTEVWGVRRTETGETTWLPWLPGKGDVARRARVRMISNIVRKMLNA